MRRLLRWAFNRSRSKTSDKARTAPSDGWGDATLMVVNLVGFIPVDLAGSLLVASPPGDVRKDAQPKPPAVALDLFNFIPSIMTQCGGSVTDTHGDVSICVFPSGDGARRAVDAALRVRAIVLGVRAATRPGAPGGGIDVRIGIASGRLFVGRFDPPAPPLPLIFGGPRRLAERLLRHCQGLRTPILLSPETVARLTNAYPVRPVSILASGEDEATTAFEPVP